MNKDYTHITMVLDRSGSMASIAEDTIGGFNRFLADQKKVPGSATITLYQFDTVFETLIDRKDIREAEELTGAIYVPRGNTALLDAIGRGINQTGSWLKSLPENDRPGKVIFVVITDGLENSSHEFTHPKIMGMIKHQHEKYRWEFVFLGADQDAIASGVQMGMQASKAMTFAKNAMGTQSLYNSVSDNTTAFRTGCAAGMEFKPADYAAQEAAGASEPSQKK